MATPPKLVLAVIDGLKPAMLERAVSTGRAPALKAIMDRGTYVDECCAAFPSVTPVCAAAIATGTRQDRHRIPSMNWYHREEGRYVEYGSSFSASRRFGIARQLTDTVLNMNAQHLPADLPPLFESLDDAGVRTAGTTYLMYRGRHEHRISRETALTRLASTVVRRSVMGPKELFYADIFASRETGCRSQLGLPGIRDQHAGCVATYLVENDLFDFLLLSLPDNDTHSHRNGPHAQVASIANADRQLERMFHAAGGADAFLDEHAVIVVADHSHAPVERRGELRSGVGRVPPPAPPPRRSSGGSSSARRSTSSTCCRRAARAATRPRSRCARRSARRWSTRCCPRAATRSSRASSTPPPRSRASTSSCGARRPARGRSGGRRASCASPRAATCGTRAAGGGPSTGRSRSSTRSCATASCARAPIPTRSPASGRRSRARPRATCCSPRRPAGSSRTGAASTTWAAAATARCTAATRSARSRSAASRRPTRTACGAGRSPTWRR